LSNAPIAFFMTGGTRLALYPLERLAEDVAPGLAISRSGFGGITLAHNVQTKEEVAQVLALAEKAGGKIVKRAQDVFWGGHRAIFPTRMATIGRWRGVLCSRSMPPARSSFSGRKSVLPDQRSGLQSEVERVVLNALRMSQIRHRRSSEQRGNAGLLCSTRETGHCSGSDNAFACQQGPS